ncbi:MAG: acetylglutamate kinase [Desulfovibrio sp.]|nr:acetylglutamate kinase [Desulfovibrio sp.]
MLATKTVIKYGGHAMTHADLAEAFAKDIAVLTRAGIHSILVHGGGPQITSLLERLAIPSRFENGLRVTDEKTMEAVEMVLAGQVNKDVVALLGAHNVLACGISGRDGGLLHAVQKDPALGRVGTVKEVSTKLLDCLLDGGFVPVVAPIAQDSSGRPLNVNADTAAGAIAGAIHADHFVLISDVPGVLDAGHKVVATLHRTDIDDFIREGVISGGMIPKVDACLHALEQGAERALILDGRAESSLRRFLLENEPLGTVILP